MENPLRLNVLVVVEGQRFSSFNLQTFVENSRRIFDKRVRAKDIWGRGTGWDPLLTRRQTEVSRRNRHVEYFICQRM